jgi:hypothetical protein
LFIKVFIASITNVDTEVPILFLSVLFVARLSQIIALRTISSFKTLQQFTTQCYIIQALEEVPLRKGQLSH